MARILGVTRTSAQAGSISPRYDDDATATTTATRWVWPRRWGGRWQSTRVLCYPTTDEGCDSCGLNNMPLTKRAVLFRTQGWAGVWNGCNVSRLRCLPHYIKFLSRRSVALKLLWRQYTYLSEVIWYKEEIFFFLFMDLSYWDNLEFNNCYVYTRKQSL